MIWGSSKKRRPELNPRQAYRKTQFEELLERLAHMSESAAMNYLAQNHLFGADAKGDGRILDDSGRLVDHEYVVALSRPRAYELQAEQRWQQSRADEQRQRIEEDAEREREESRQRARALRQRLRQEAGLPPEEPEALDTSLRIPTPEERRAEDEARRAAYHSRQAEQRARWLEATDREAAAQEAVRAAKAAEKEARREAQAAKRGVMKKERTRTARLLATALRQAEAASGGEGDRSLGQLLPRRTH